MTKVFSKSKNALTFVNYFQTIMQPGTSNFSTNTLPPAFFFFLRNDSGVPTVAQRVKNPTQCL